MLISHLPAIPRAPSSVKSHLKSHLLKHLALVNRTGLTLLICASLDADNGDGVLSRHRKCCVIQLEVLVLQVQDRKRTLILNHCYATVEWKGLLDDWEDVWLIVVLSQSQWWTMHRKNQKGVNHRGEWTTHRPLKAPTANPPVGGPELFSASIPRH